MAKFLTSWWTSSFLGRTLIYVVIKPPNSPSSQLKYGAILQMQSFNFISIWTAADSISQSVVYSECHQTSLILHIQQILKILYKVYNFILNLFYKILTGHSHYFCINITDFNTNQGL
jgi:hypothetical protein